MVLALLTFHENQSDVTAVLARISKANQDCSLKSKTGLFHVHTGTRGFKEFQLYMGELLRFPL